MEGKDPTEFTLREKVNFVAQGVMSGKIFELAKPANVSLWKELSSSFTKPEVKEMLAREMEGVAEPERRTFLMANLVCEQLAFRFFEKFIQQIRAGNVIESIQALSGIAPLRLKCPARTRDAASPRPANPRSSSSIASVIVKLS